MLYQENEVKTIYLNVPKELNLQLLFNEFKPVFIPKIHFLIHQINFNHFNGGYQINIKNHSWFFGIKDGELSAIISKLLDNDIITKTGNYQRGKKSNSYSMVDPYTYKDNDAIAKYAYQVEKYSFLQKWVADKNVVKSQKDSAFIKASSKGQIQQLQDEIKALRKQLAKYEAQTKVNDLLDQPEASLQVIDPAIMVAPQPPIIIEEVTEAEPYDEDYENFKIEYLKRKNQCA